MKTWIFAAKLAVLTVVFGLAADQLTHRPSRAKPVQPAATTPAPAASSATAGGKMAPSTSH